MKVWTFTFSGYWPVGAGGVVLAPTLEDALEAARELVKDYGRPGLGGFDEGTEDSVFVYPEPVKAGRIILDGDY